MGDAKPRRILLGRIGAAHGIKGAVRIATFTDDPLGIAGYGPLDTNRPGVKLTITNARLSNDAVIAQIQGITDRNAAEALNGVELSIDRDRLPELEEDDFYHTDLIGLEARTEAGDVLGQVIAVPNFGAGDLVEVRDAASGATVLYPFTRAVVPHIHVAEGYLVIVPPEESAVSDEDMARIADEQDGEDLDQDNGTEPNS